MNTFLLLVFVPVSFIATGCDGGGNGPTPGDDEPWIPDFTQVWKDIADTLVVYSLDPGADLGRAFGDLTGKENMHGAFSDLNGLFDQRNVEFTIERDGGVDVTGRFVHRDTLTVTSREGTRRLVRREP